MLRAIFCPAIFILLILCVLIAVGDQRYQSARFLAESIALVSANLSEDFGPEDVFNTSWNGMKDILDPFTNFIPASSYRYVEEESRGSFEGIGVEITVRDGLVTVISPIAGSHAEEVGLRPGDQVISVDSVDVTGMPADGVTRMIRGPAGTTVLLGIRRPGFGEDMEVAVERRRIGLSSVPFSGVVDSVGYIRLTRFSLGTPCEFNDAIDRLTAQGISLLILDLRGNPGGFMSSAVYIAEMFLPEGEVVVATRSERRWENYTVRSTGDGPLVDLPLVILIDGGSASASEIVAGALQDHDRAVIIGDTTFGKGLVQTNLLLDGGNAFRVTTSKYYLPSGRLVQRLSDKDWARHIAVSSEELDAAYKTTGGRSVYGGGGVAPDVPSVSPGINYLSSALAYGSYFFRFSIDYRVLHGDSIPIEVGGAVLQDFRDYVNDKGFVPPNPFLRAIDNLEHELAGIDSELIRDRINAMKRTAESFVEQEWIEAEPFIVRRLRERFARQSGGIEEVYLSCRLRYDSQILTAIDLLEDRELYDRLLKGN
jgi:carboxyl-terminal processing protease